MGRAAAQSGWWAERWSKGRKYEGCGRPLHIAAVPLSWPLAGGEEISKNTSTASTKSQCCKTMTLYRQRPRIGMLWSPITITGSGTCQLRYWSADSPYQEVLLMQDNGLFLLQILFQLLISTVRHWKPHIFNFTGVILLLMSVKFICIHWVFKYILGITLKWGWGRKYTLLTAFISSIEEEVQIQLINMQYIIKNSPQDANSLIFQL